jgi:Predicted membrane protein
MSRSRVIVIAGLLAAAVPALAQAQTRVTTHTAVTPDVVVTRVDSVTLSSGKRVPISTKVAASVAQSAKISSDSAFAVASANAKNGEVSSAELEMAGGRLVYEVKVLNRKKKSSEVVVDAMTGEVLKAQQYGGLKGRVIHHQENNKLKNAATDTTVKVKSSVTVTPRP